MRLIPEADKIDIQQAVEDLCKCGWLHREPECGFRISQALERSKYSMEAIKVENYAVRLILDNLGNQFWRKFSGYFLASTYCRSVR